MPGVSTAAVAVAIIAPPPVFRVPPRPEAEPAKCGLTDIMPAFALGSTIPWPIPVSNTHPKNDIGIGSVNMKRLIHKAIPIEVIIEPIEIILLIPKNTENLPETQLPIT